MTDSKKKRKKRRPSAGSRPASQVSSTPSLDELNEHHRTIFSLIRNQTQIDFSNYKLTTVNRRIQRQMKAHKIEDFGDYVAYLESKPEAVRLLCDEVFIHVTEFFRDPESYAALEKRIYPSLVKNRHPGAPLRIWVPGCSTGEEAYSIAISLLEFIAGGNHKIPIQVFATDISEQAVQKARSGIYTEHEVSGVSSALRKKYFDRLKEGYRIKRAIRDDFVFSRHDLTSNPPFAKMDLISCRNVLIYFAQGLQRQVMPVFHYALNRDGFLWLGKSEAPVGISKLFALTDSAHKIYSKINTATPISFRAPALPPIAAPNDRKKTKSPLPPLDFQKEFDRIVVSRYGPSGVVVNSDLEILQLRGDNSPYLSLGSGQPNYNLAKLLRPELLLGIRLAFQAAQKKNTSIRKENLGYEIAKERRKVSIEVIPINVHLPLKARQYVILFDESHSRFNTEPPIKKPALKKIRHLVSPEDAYVAELLEEIDGMREYQQSLAEGYEATQEELTSSNEELQSTIEEFQSTNEELETTKEELQASNEELTTLNDELQKRNEELLSAIEAQARSEEKFRLLISGVKDYAIFMLDPEGKVVSWNDGAKRMKGYEEGEILGQQFAKFYLPEDVQSGIPQKELETAREKGNCEVEGFKVRKDGSTFFAHALTTAIFDEDGNLRGYSRVIRDITERKAVEQNLTETEFRYRQMIEAVRDYAIYRLDPLGRVLTWNEGATRLKGYAAEEIVGKHFSVFYPEELRNEGYPQHELEVAARDGRFENEGWRVRKDGSRFWANVIVARIGDENGELLGFTKITRDLSDKKKAEIALKDSEARNRLMIAAVKDYAIFMLNSEGQVATWNDGAKHIQGYTSDEILGRHFAIFYVEEERGVDNPATLLEVAARDGHHEDEGWRVKKSGERYWASVSITRLSDDSGKPMGFSMVIRDLTERKRAEDTRTEDQRKSALLEQVRENERTLDQIFSESPTFMCLTVGPNHVYERANQKYLELLNLPFSIVGQQVIDVLPEIEMQGFIKLLDGAYTSGIAYRTREAPIRLRGSDGKERLYYLDFAYQPLRNPQGQVYALIHQGFDVTEKVQSRKSVENERENFRNLFRQTPEMVCILRGPEHTFEFVNEAHIKALGFDATGMAVRKAQPESVEVHGILDEVYRSGNTAELHEIPVTLTGRLRYFNLTYAARRDDAGQINGIMILGVEVTEPVLARHQIQESLRTRDEFVSIASHELKTPLTSLKMVLQLVQRRTRPELDRVPTAAELADALTLSLKQIDSLTNLVEDLLDISRIRAGKLLLNRESVNLADLISDTVKRFAEPLASAHNELRLELDPVTGLWDERRLDQVVVNLISNSIKYAPAAPITIALRQAGDRALLRFSDLGPGIPKDKQPAIFDRFERANASHNVGGLGLGLFIVKSIVEAHQGTILIDGDVGSGTTFLIELPLKPDMTKEPEMTSED